MVNTFIPFRSFKKIAQALDTKRLGKQRVEAMQIINIIDGKTNKKGFKNHPAVRMWKKYPDALKHYHDAMIDEWVRRGHKNTMNKYNVKKKLSLPWFMKNKAIRLSYQANLIVKDPKHYKPLFTPGPPSRYLKYSYIWYPNLTPDKLKYLKSRPNEVVDISKFADTLASLK